MNIVEELNGVYFHKGICNTSVGELFSRIFLDKIGEQLGGTKGVVTMSCIAFGLPLLRIRDKPYGTTQGISIAFKYSREFLNVTLSVRLPAIANASIKYLKPIMTNSLGALVGQTIPMIGWALFVSDVVQIVYKTTNTYNITAREEDRVQWPTAKY